MAAARLIRTAAVIGALVLGLAAGAGAQQQKRPPGTSEAGPKPGPPPPAGGPIGSFDAVTADQIAAAGARDIKAALALVPSLVINETGGPGGVATISMRGSSAEQVLVLLDGRRLASTRSSSFNINDIPVPIERIERIEVLPAPVSVLYGADAIGGVVNIVTRPAGPKPSFRVGGGLGSDGESRLSGGLQYGAGRVGLTLDGQLRAGDGFRDNGDFDLKNLAAGLAFAPAPWGASLRWSLLERESGVPGPAALPTPSARQKDSRDELRADFAYAPAGGWGVNASFHSRRQSLHLDDPEPPQADPSVPAGPIATFHENRSRGFEAQTDFSTTRNERYSVGGDWQSESTEDGEDASHETESWGVFAQDQWHVGNWTAVGAIRRDEHSVFGEETSPSLSVGWAASGWRLWGSWSRGYRVPSFDELYGGELYPRGNPDLVPETSENYEGGAEFGGGAGFVRLNTFWRDVTDLISWADTDADGVSRPENIAAARVSGWEAQVLYRVSPRISIPLGYQSLSVVDDTTGERLPGSVHSVWHAALQATSGPLVGSIEYVATDRGDFQFRDGAWRYAVVNAAIAWRKKFGSVPVQISVRGENLQDEDYETVEGFPQSGRSWFAEAKVGL